jgi:hypothetical protein
VNVMERQPVEIIGCDETGGMLVWLKTAKPCSKCAIPTVLGVIVFDYSVGNSLFCWRCLVERRK